MTREERRVKQWHNTVDFWRAYLRQQDINPRYDEILWLESVLNKNEVCLSEVDITDCKDMDDIFDRINGGDYS